MNDELSYIPISVAVLKRFKAQLPFDIFVKRTETAYTKIFKRSDTLDWDRVNNYVKKGIINFFVTNQ